MAGTGNGMSLVSAAARCGALLGCVALSATLLAGAASAQGTARQRDACTPDVFRLCSNDIPDVQRIVSCLNRHKASLSKDCRMVMNGGDGQETARR